MKVLFVSLGCDKNLVDSERMLGLLNEKGFELTNEETQAEVIVINTCCFIHDAREESITTILEMAAYKQKGTLKALIVTGCLAERYREEIIKEIPEVDAIVGSTAWEDIAAVIGEALEGGKAQSFRDVNYLSPVYPKRVNTTGGYYSYLKIAEGCSKHCTYCIIPRIRGDYRSAGMEELMAEAEYLAKGGVKELVLVAQETTVYGTDLYGRKALPELLDRLCRIEGISWIRLLYCYPEEITAELIDVIKREPKICHYLDIPIQHASDAILKRMGRRTTRHELQELIGLLRKEIPDIVLRTSLITGFPGETQEDHEILKDFVRRMRFDRLGVFPYSREEGTPADKMKPQITKKVKLARRRELMQIQQEIAFAAAKEKIGKVYDVLIEGELPEEEVYVGRTYMDAPGVDGYLFLKAGPGLLSGDMVKAAVTGAKDYDLIGELYQEEQEGRTI